MAITKIYTGKLVDLNIIANADYRKAINCEFDLSSEEIVTGIYKVIQQFVTLLLSAPTALYPNCGSKFMQGMLDGSIVTQIDASSSFRSSVNDIIVLLTDTYTSTTKDDEKLEDVTLTSLDISGGKLTIYATLSTVAGTSADIVLPVKAVIK